MSSSSSSRRIVVPKEDAINLSSSEEDLPPLDLSILTELTSSSEPEIVTSRITGNSPRQSFPPRKKRKSSLRDVKPQILRDNSSSTLKVLLGQGNSADPIIIDSGSDSDVQILETNPTQDSHHSLTKVNGKSHLPEQRIILANASAGPGPNTPVCNELAASDQSATAAPALISSESSKKVGMRPRLPGLFLDFGSFGFGPSSGGADDGDLPKSPTSTVSLSLDDDPSSTSTSSGKRVAALLDPAQQLASWKGKQRRLDDPSPDSAVTLDGDQSTLVDDPSKRLSQAPSSQTHPRTRTSSPAIVPLPSMLSFEIESGSSFPAVGDNEMSTIVPFNRIHKDDPQGSLVPLPSLDFAGVNKIAQTQGQVQNSSSFPPPVANIPLNTSSAAVVQDAMESMRAGLADVKVEPASASSALSSTIPEFKKLTDIAKKEGMSTLKWLRAKKDQTGKVSASPQHRFELIVPSLSPAQRALYTHSSSSSSETALPVSTTRKKRSTAGSTPTPNLASSSKRRTGTGAADSPYLHLTVTPPEVSFIDRLAPQPTMSDADWRRYVSSGGESEVEIILDRDFVGRDSSNEIDSIDNAEDQSFPALVPSDQLVPSRRGTAVRHVDSPFLRRWNEICGSGLTPNHALHRSMFENYITDSTCFDEPFADQIEVKNEVERDGPPPDFEFVYTNQMVYDRNVPDPELGLGCDCDGPCDPRSNTCSCVKRQKLYFYNFDYHGFAYDDNGRLKDNQFSIWECGPTCGCPPECYNRVIQRGRSKETKVDLFKTAMKGWGVRARAPIPYGTFVGIYAGELITEDEGELRGITYEKVGRTYLFDCDGWHISNPPKGLRDVDPRLADLSDWTVRRARDAADGAPEGYSYSAYSVDAFHYGNFTRYFNHSCDPNLALIPAYVKDFHPERPLMVIFTRRNILKGEELCISYKGLPDDQEEDERIKTPPKRGGTKKGSKSKTSAPAHVTARHLAEAAEAKRPLSKDVCYCNSHNCDGYMFNVGGE